MPAGIQFGPLLATDELPDWALAWRQKKMPPRSSTQLRQDYQEPTTRDMLGPGTHPVTDSRLTWFIDRVRTRLFNCRVYFYVVEKGAPSFKVEAMAVAEVDGGLFAVNMRSPSISSAATMNKVMDEAELLCNGLAKQMGVAIFFGTGKKLEKTDIPMFKEPA